MRRFCELYEAIDQTTSTNAKVAALAAYFRDAPPADAAWAIFFLTGRRLKRVVPSAGLRAWAQEATGLPEWLLYECYSAAGDFGELVALALDAVAAGSAGAGTAARRRGSRSGCCRCRKPTRRSSARR